MILLSTRMCIICCSEFIRGYYAGQKTTATSLAEKFKLNIRTLNPALNKLTRAKILRSQVGGVDRGYILTRDPHDISIYDIIIASQGVNYMKTCNVALKGATCALPDCNDCILFKTSKMITDQISEEYKKISIYDLYHNQEGLSTEGLQIFK
ncbi:MAG: Rrf2 family transcriptional regulator [Rikenellaceae bacterium]